MDMDDVMVVTSRFRQLATYYENNKNVKEVLKYWFRMYYSDPYFAQYFGMMTRQMIANLIIDNRDKHRKFQGEVVQNLLGGVVDEFTRKVRQDGENAAELVFNFAALAFGIPIKIFMITSGVAEKNQVFIRLILYYI